MTLSNEFFVNELGGNASPTILSDARSKTAGGPYMARLGEYEFSLETAAFQNIRRTTDYRWEGQNRIGRKPGQQFLGEGEDKLELPGVIYPHFRGGLGQLDLMRKMAGGGKPLALIYAFENVGQYAGLWCISSISDDRSGFIGNGAARKIEFSISLTAYGEDDDVAAEIKRQMDGSKTPVGGESPPPLSADAIMDLVENSLTLDSLLDIYDDDWSAKTDGALGGIGGIVDSVGNAIKDKVNGIKDKLENTIKDKMPW